MNILEKIARHKVQEVQMKKDFLPLEVLEVLPHFSRKCISLSRNLRSQGSGIITEFKRRSPSEQNINLEVEVEAVTTGYEKAGAAGLSILTDEDFFGGSNDDLLITRENVQLPLLRKDFIIDEYQIYEAKAIGADVILLIAAILSPAQMKKFSELAKELGLEVLLEIHNETELQKSLDIEVPMIGVNNRNLKTFQVDLNISKELAPKIPSGVIKISESGINNPASIKELKEYGYKGFLIGTNFMRTQDPGKSAEEFIKATY